MAKKSSGDAQLDKAGEVLTELFKGIGRGIKNVSGDLFMLLIFLGVTGASIYVFMSREKLMAIWGIETIGIPYFALQLVWICPLILLYVFGQQDDVNDEETLKNLQSIKFCNKGGEYPELIKKTQDGKKEILTFKNPGIPISDWKQRWASLETTLDCHIIKMNSDKKTKKKVHLHTVPASMEIPELIKWQPEYLSDKDFVIVAGQGLLESVEFNLDKYPHALIGGTTGSGKSVVLRVLLYECILKGATPFMIDFKGGIELTAFDIFGEVVHERNEALELLKEVNRELSARLTLFRELGVKNLTEYNRKYPDEELTRIVIACDEVAEMLDKTGLSAADAAIYKEIEAEMATIARLGRAPGINMLLGTQRPDAKVIMGQIKNNLPIRISGRMTDVHASEMVLGNTKAADMDDTLGRFLYNVGSDTWEFQGYLFEDEDIVPGNYQKGRLLIDDVSNEAEDISEDEMLQGELQNSGEAEWAVEAKKRTLGF